MKKIHYLQGLPRAGNTILGSLINQSNDMQLTANSIGVEILHRILTTREMKHFLHFPDNTSIINSAKAGFLAYYDHIDYSHIIDRGLWGVPVNLDYVKEVNLPRKFILLYRPLFECVGSTIQVLDSDEMEASTALGFVASSALGFENILKSDEQFIVITYDEICEAPQTVVNKVFDFIKAPRFDLDFNNIKQFEYNGMQYNDFDHPWHTIKTDRIEKDVIDYTSYIPKDVVKKYQDQHNRLHDLVMERK